MVQIDKGVSNYPPADANPLADRLREQYAELEARAEELARAVHSVPAEVTESNVDRVNAFVRQLREHSKQIEAIRVAEKEAFLEAGRTVDGYFGRIKQLCVTGIVTVEKRITAYLSAKAAAERRAREEEAARQRAEQIRREAEAEAAEAALAEAARKAEEQRRQAETADPARQVAAARMEQEALDRAVEAERLAKEQAEQTRQAEEAAKAKTADLARTRGALGGTATIQTVLDFDIVDHKRAIEALVNVIEHEAVVRAVRAYIRSEGPNSKDRLVKEQPLAGVKFRLREVARVV